MKKFRLKTFFVYVMVALLTISFITGCEGKKANDAEKIIKIGLVGPWTGASADPGQSMRRGAELAVKNINAKGGVDGYKIELIAYDDKSVPEESVNAVNKLITKDEVLAIVGAYNSSCTLADKEVANAEKTVLLTPISTSDDVITGSDFIFRNTPGNRESKEVERLLVDDPKTQFLYTDGVGVETMAIIWANNDYGKGYAVSLPANAKEVGKEKNIVISIPYTPGTTDFYPQLTKIIEKKPDEIYVVALTTEAIQIVKQARELGYKGLLFGTGGFNTEEFDKSLGDLAEGCLFITPWHKSYPYEMSKEFYKLHQEVFPNIEPDMFTANAYEAVYIVKKGIENAGKYPKDMAKWRVAVRDGIAGIKGMDGICGEVTMNENGQTYKDFGVLQKRKGGESVIVLPRSKATGELIKVIN